jgi:hypothetical protein
LDTIPEDSPPPAPPAPPPARKLRVLSRSVPPEMPMDSETPARKLRVLSRSVAREMPMTRADVPPAPVQEVRSTRTPAHPELRVLARRARFLDTARAVGATLRAQADLEAAQHGLSPAEVPFDPKNPANDWRHKFQSPDPVVYREEEPTLAEKALWARGELALKTRE